MCQLSATEMETPNPPAKPTLAPHQPEAQRMKLEYRKVRPRVVLVTRRQRATDSVAFGTSQARR